MSEQINLKALCDLSIIDIDTIKTDLPLYVKNVFEIIDKLFEIDTSSVVLKYDLKDRTRCRADVFTSYDHPSTRSIIVDRVVTK